MKKENFKINNLQCLINNHGMSIEYGNAIISIERSPIECDSFDVVVYDVENLEIDGERIYDYKGFYKFCEQADRNEEEFELDRMTLVRQ